MKLLKIYLTALKNTYNALVRSWIIIPFSAILLIASKLILGLLLKLGPSGASFTVGGFLAGMFAIFALSIFYKWLSITISSSRLRLEDIKDMNFAFFSPILNVAFILFVVNLLAQTLFITNKSLIIIVNFIIIILFNVAPECIILKNYYGTETLAESFNFVKSYYVEWFLPYIIFFLPLIILNPKAVLLMISFNDVLLPSNTFYKGSEMLLMLLPFNNFYATILISYILALFFSIFRIYLFDALWHYRR
ncbi:MAG: hypothetical protein ACOX3T_05840 [Bdellovibrionota bacterium]